MDLRPEQRRALDYLRRKGTEATPAQLRDHLASTFREFESLLEIVPAAWRAAPPGPGRWSAHEVVDHLVVSHRAAVEQLRLLVAGSRPREAVPPGLQSERPLDRSWDDLCAELRAIHRAFVDLVATAPENLSLDVKAPIAMVVKVPNEAGELAPLVWEHELDWKAFAQAFRSHTLEHRAQIARNLAQLAGGAGAEAGAAAAKLDLLRHALATLAYRGGKALRGAPETFAEFKAGEATRTPGQILAHIGDLLDWALHLANGEHVWRDSPLLPWPREIDRFYAALHRLDERLGGPAAPAASPERLFQGPIADALTHVGQIALLRRLAASPVRGENYFKAEIAAGRVGAEQAAPRREFD
jgi:hypothetical protein